MIGYAMCGSFCTFEKSFAAARFLVSRGYELVPVMSEHAYNTDTRFGSAEYMQKTLTEICKKEIVCTIKDSEPFGPKIKLDALIVSPVTGNTLAKIAAGITDTAVTMAVKAHLRNGSPLLLAPATNDGLSSSLKNIGHLLEKKNVYFVPFAQDDPVGKPNSLVCDFTMIPASLEAALSGKQIQPVII